MKKSYKVLIAAVLLLVSIFSVTALAGWSTSVKVHEKTIASIDQKIATVMELTAASTASSALVSAMPGDTATPIADKLADFSTYFLMVLSVLYLEKYLVSMTGYAVFWLLLPLACLFLGISLFHNPGHYRRLGKRLALFGAALFLMIPVSIKTSDMIYAKYEESIEATLDAAKDSEKASAEIQEAKDSGLLDTLKDKTSELVKSASKLLNRFIEALAVMIVTSCLIPVMILVFLIWLTKILLQADLPMMAYMRRIPAELGRKE